MVTKVDTNDPIYASKLVKETDYYKKIKEIEDKIFDYNNYNTTPKKS